MRKAGFVHFTKKQIERNAKIREKMNLEEDDSS
jgi:hypothetical protein